MSGKLIVFEGVDGTGKSTQIRHALDWIKANGFVVESYREPGGTEVGERIRTLLLDKAISDIEAHAEMMLFFASRAQLAHEKIRPALKDENKIVLLDRYFYSTAAYQGPFVSGGFEAVLSIARTLNLPEPDLVLCLDIDPEVAAKRRSEKGDRIEAKGLDYQRKVREAYQVMAERWNVLFKVVDASRTIEEVKEEIASHLKRLFFPLRFSEMAKP
jgi:dTMP kinase